MRKRIEIAEKKSAIKGNKVVNAGGFIIHLRLLSEFQSSLKHNYPYYIITQSHSSTAMDRSNG